MPWIYFIQAGESGPIKVGRTRNLYDRLRGLQTANPHVLRIIGAAQMDSMDEAVETERRLHRDLADDNVSGEWFSPSRVLLGIAESYGPATCDHCSGIVTSAPLPPSTGPCFVCVIGGRA